MSSPQPYIPNCRNCGTAMTAGFAIDRGHYGIPGEAVWCEGQPEKSFWTGLKTSQVSTGRKIRGFRCPQCGLLELYAVEPNKK